MCCVLVREFQGDPEAKNVYDGNICCDCAYDF